MDIYKVRWLNFRELAGAGERGWIKRAAERLGKAQAQVSHFGSDAPSKNIGEKVAREIEVTFGKPRGWLDTLNHSTLPTDGTVASEAISHELNPAHLAQAVKWVRYEEAKAKRVYHPERHAERLIALYRQIEADGGVLAPEHAEAIIQGEVHAEPKREQAAR